MLPLLDPNGERELIREVVEEVVCNADTWGIRLSINLNALTHGFPQPIGLVTNVCRLDHEYPR